MAATSSSKGAYKWYIFHRNHLMSLYLLGIYLSISVLVLHDLAPVFYLIPATLVVVLMRLAWEQPSSVLSALALFMVGFAVCTFCIGAVRTRQQRALQLMYNYEQFKNLTDANPKIHKQTRSHVPYNIFFVETNPNRGTKSLHHSFV